MKKVVSMILAGCMVLSMAACGGKTDAPATETTAVETTVEETKAPETLAEFLVVDFKDQLAKDSELSAKTLAEGIISNEKILFAGDTMEVEPGLLTGFGNAEITGFEEGAMFAPIIGSIPFVGYVFTLESEDAVEDFKKTLTDNANPRWNICTEAEETLIDSVGKHVFFVMCPKSLEE